MSLLFIFLVMSVRPPKMNPQSKIKSKFHTLLHQSGFPHLALWGEVFVGPVKYLVLLPIYFFIYFLTSHVAHPTRNELRVLSLLGIYGSEERLARFAFPKCPLLFFFSPITGAFTLHSDQSFPGTPGRLCSRTGIDPGNTEFHH